MEAFTTIWNHLLGIGTIAMMIASLVCIYAIILPDDRFSRFIQQFAARNILVLGFLISFAALVTSQVYERVIGYPPCEFCWYARVFFYPQVILFGIALAKKDLRVLPYAMGLTIAGLVISTYHSIVTVVGESPLPCDATGVSCLTRYVYQYGFISIPLMGLVGFALIFLLIQTSKKASTATF
jgi:hypothetical protein